MHMVKMIRASATAVLAATALLGGTPAFASYILETATAGSGGSGNYQVVNDPVNGTNFIGASFEVSDSGVTSLRVGANVDAFGSGQVFAEIVPLASLSSVPNVTGSTITSWLQSNNVGDSLLTAPGTAGDASTVINFASALTPGSYAVIFGSGLYGANGEINLTDGNTTVGSPNLFTNLYGDSFQSYGYDTQMRVFVAPVPLPAALPLLGSGLLAGFGFLRRRRSAAIES